MLSSIVLPFIGEITLTGSILVVFFLCVLACIAFEFVNGFHDTANAVATVIYTKSMKPNYAVPWSGAFNFLGVAVGGVAVAMGVLKLVPLDDLMQQPVAVGACLVLAVLLASIIWNLGTWYLGIPCSSSHTLIGAMIGGGLGFSYYYGGSVNWSKASEIGLSLLLSPIVGFGLAVLLMWFFKNVLKAKSLFHVPEGEDDKPPLPIRLLLITTCTLVSFFHGSNDGQKGVGLLMLVFVAFLPARFALNHEISNDQIHAYMQNVEQTVMKVVAENPNDKNALALDSVIRLASMELANAGGNAKETFSLRKHIQVVSQGATALLDNKDIQMSAEDREALRKDHAELTKVTDYAPTWVIAIISISLGLGTMIGWKRIVVTIGEKIGKEHLNYAQGATAEIVAASTIGLSSGLGLPVSTTHVLSSGIAGAMVASNGAKNLNNGTLKNIAIAWLLTLPVTIILGLGLFFIFHLFL